MPLIKTQFTSPNSQAVSYPTTWDRVLAEGLPAAEMLRAVAHQHPVHDVKDARARRKQVPAVSGRLGESL